MPNQRTILLAGFCLLPLRVLAADDPTLQWLLETKATSAPATQRSAGPATLPGSPISPLTKARHADTVITAQIKLNNGSTLTGNLTTTATKPLRVWVEQEHAYHDIPLDTIATIQATVLWERDEKEFHYIASGSDLKEFTGRTYPARETAYTITLKDGDVVSGGVVAPLYVELPDGQQKTLVLHKRDKGQPNQKLADLLYVEKVTITPIAGP